MSDLADLKQDIFADEDKFWTSPMPPTTIAIIFGMLGLLADLGHPAGISSGSANLLFPGRRHPPVSLSAGPEIKRIRLLFLVSRAVRFLDQRKAPCFIKAPGPHIAQERPKLQASKRALGDIQQLGA